MTGHGGFKRITGTKIHVAVEQNGLPVSVAIGSANIHDSKEFTNVVEDISEFVGDGSIRQIVSALQTRDTTVMPLGIIWQVKTSAHAFQKEISKQRTVLLQTITTRRDLLLKDSLLG